MQFVPFNNVVKVDYCYTWNGQEVMNCLNYQAPSSLTRGILDDAANAAFDSWETNIKPNQVSQAALRLIRVTDLTTDSSPAVEFSDGLPVNGVSAVGSVPNNVTIALKFYTGLRGRSYRGRMYFIGLPKVNVTNNTLDTSWVTGLQNVGESLMALVVSGVDWPLVICSRYHNKTIRSIGVATEVIGVSVDSTVDSQRRRLPGRGR